MCVCLRERESEKERKEGRGGREKLMFNAQPTGTVISKKGSEGEVIIKIVCACVCVCVCVTERV